MNRKLRQFAACTIVSAIVSGGCSDGCRVSISEGTFGGFEEEVADLAAGCDLELISVATGHCETHDFRFVVFGSGFGGSVRYYEPDSGEFVAFSGHGDLVDPLCFGRHYGPVKIVCPDAMITEVFCGPWQAGDPIQLD